MQKVHLINIHLQVFLKPKSMQLFKAPLQIIFILLNLLYHLVS